MSYTMKKGREIYTSLFARKAATTSERSTKHTTTKNKQNRKKLRSKRNCPGREFPGNISEWKCPDPIHSATERSRICLGGETKTGRKYWQPCFPVRLLCRRGYEKLRFSATISFYLGNDTRYVPVTILIRTCPCGSALAVAKALR